MKSILVLLLIICSRALLASQIDEVRVYKVKRKMDLLSQGRVIKSYSVMLGRGGLRAKIKEGDNLVPEGRYQLDYKNAESLFYKSLHVSYPNEDDIRRANEAGVPPGGDIMIHGYPNKPRPLFKFLERIGLIKLVNWTAGCIAVNNQEMDEVFKYIDVPIPITILH